MTSTRTQWLRVTRERRCPVCGKADWCLVAADGTAAICPRTESTKRCGDAGFLHRLADAPRAAVPRRATVPVRGGLPDFSALAAEFRRAAPVESLHALAAELGVSAESLRTFGLRNRRATAGAGNRAARTGSDGSRRSGRGPRRATGTVPHARGIRHHGAGARRRRRRSHLALALLPPMSQRAA